MLKYATFVPYYDTFAPLFCNIFVINCHFYAISGKSWPFFCNKTVIWHVYYKSITKKWHENAQKSHKSGSNFLWQDRQTGPTNMGRLQEPYSPRGSTEDLNGRKERAAKCDLYVNLTHKIIDSCPCFLYNLYVNLTG